MRRPFSRTYGTIFPSSLTRVISIALVFSTRLPVSVLVRARATSLEAFLGGMASGTYGLRPRHNVSVLPDGFSNLTTYALAPGLPSPGIPYPTPSPRQSNGGYVVLEYQPVVHRLRLAASA